MLWFALTNACGILPEQLQKINIARFVSEIARLRQENNALRQNRGQAPLVLQLTLQPIQRRQGQNLANCIQALVLKMQGIRENIRKLKADTTRLKLLSNNNVNTSTAILTTRSSWRAHNATSIQRSATASSQGWQETFQSFLKRQPNGTWDALSAVLRHCQTNQALKENLELAYGILSK